MLWVGAAATVVLILAGGGVLVWLLATSKYVPRQPRQPRAAVLAGSGEWYAQPALPGMGLEAMMSRVGGWGRLRIADGWVSFVPDGAGEPEWSLPAREVEVRPPSFGPEIGLRHPLIGEKVIQISRSKNARWRSSGSIGTLNDRAPAQDAASVLRGWGARDF